MTVSADHAHDFEDIVHKSGILVVGVKKQKIKVTMYLTI